MLASTTMAPDCEVPEAMPTIAVQTLTAGDSAVVQVGHTITISTNASTSVDNYSIRLIISRSSACQDPAPTDPVPRNEDIVDRAIFADLQSLLPASSDFQSAALWGLGGSG